MLLALVSATSMIGGGGRGGGGGVALGPFLPLLRRDRGETVVVATVRAWSDAGGRSDWARNFRGIARLHAARKLLP